MIIDQYNNNAVIIDFKLRIDIFSKLLGLLKK